MGIIKQGILGGLSGKVGNVVGSSWKGIHYLRSLPSHVTNPNTLGQRNSRLKMNLVIGFLKTCTAFIRVGFSGFAVKMSAFNAATSLNLGQAISGEFPNLTLNYGQFQVTRGNLLGVQDPLIAATEPGRVDFAWVDNSAGGNASAGDTVMLLVYNPDKQSSVYKLNAGVRADQAASVELPADYSGDRVHCYIAFADTAKLVGAQPKDYTSNSAYAGSTEVM